MNKEFRSTLWFKKGVLDADAAERAAISQDSLEVGAADLLPVEDRYRDDGSVTAADTEKFGLRTGGTQHVPLVADIVSIPPGDVSTLVGDLKRGRIKIVMLGASLAAVLATLLAVV